MVIVFTFKSDQVGSFEPKLVGEGLFRYVLIRYVLGEKMGYRVGNYTSALSYEVC